MVIKYSNHSSDLFKSVSKIPYNHKFRCLSEIEDRIVLLTNFERSRRGLSSLKNNISLQILSRYRCNEMLQCGYFDHKSPVTGYKASDLAEICGYRYKIFGENIYYSKGFNIFEITAERIAAGWMNSPGHRANILNSQYTNIGVGVLFTSDGKICEATQLFSCL